MSGHAGNSIAIEVFMMTEPLSAEKFFIDPVML
jgi:hypothetical protein